MECEAPEAGPRRLSRKSRRHGAERGAREGARSPDLVVRHHHAAVGRRDGGPCRHQQRPARIDAQGESRPAAEGSRGVQESRSAVSPRAVGAVGTLVRLRAICDLRDPDLATFDLTTAARGRLCDRRESRDGSQGSCRPAKGCLGSDRFRRYRRRARRPRRRDPPGRRVSGAGVSGLRRSRASRASSMLPPVVRSRR